jgi:dTDP-4-amino-4,6-dideoxygalactose transaminase
MMHAQALYQYSRLTSSEQLKNVDYVLQRGDQSAALHGHFVPMVEQLVAEQTQHQYATAVSSATTAFELAFRALGIGIGDQVILPEIGWISVGGAICNSGAEPVVAPVSKSLTMEWGHLMPAITHRTKAVVLAHLRGREAVDAARIARELKKIGIPLIEDCAQAWGAVDPGLNPRPRGLLSIYSMQAYKVISGGEGGMILTDDVGLDERIRLSAGYTKGAAGREDDWKLNARLSEIQAAAVLPQLKNLPSLTTSLRALQQRLHAAVRLLPDIVEMLPQEGVSSNGSIAGLWFAHSDSRDRAARILRAAGCVVWSPDNDDLHVGASWPISCSRSSIDVRCYLDIAIPWLAPGSQDLAIEVIENALAQSLSPDIASKTMHYTKSRDQGRQ